MRLPPQTDRIGVMGDSGENHYLRDAVMTATPEQLQLMLYDGCIRFTRQGRDAIQHKDYETSYEKLTRAQNIVLEMQNGLNYDVNRELCERVASIYGFLYRKLVDTRACGRQIRRAGRRRSGNAGQLLRRGVASDAPRDSSRTRAAETCPSILRVESAPNEVGGPRDTRRGLNPASFGRAPGLRTGRVLPTVSARSHR